MSRECREYSTKFVMPKLKPDKSGGLYVGLQDYCFFDNIFISFRVLYSILETLLVN